MADVSRIRAPGEMPEMGDQLPPWGYGWTQRMGRWLLKVWGWHVVGEFPNRSKFVAIVAPHTSNIDFFVGLFCIIGMGLRASWMAKHTLFYFPIGIVMRWLGGIPVNRTERLGVVQQMAGTFDEREHLILGVTPEGTRSRVEEWKSGFHRIAVAAKVPILLVYFDYPSKQIGFGPLVEPSKSLDADMVKIREFYRAFQGRHPENMSP